MPDTRTLLAVALVSAAAAAPCWPAAPLDGLLACRTVADATARLECFDRAAEAAAQANAQTQTRAPAQSQAAPPLPAQSPSQSPPPFRKGGVAPPAEPVIEAHVARVSQPPNGRADFTLDNGQVWRQMDPESASSARVGDSVEVSPARLGAYWLKVRSGRAWKVTRVQ